MDKDFIEAENKTGDIASPQGAENNTEEIAQPRTGDMDDTEFDAYISGLKDGSAGSENTTQAEEHDALQNDSAQAEEKQPFRTFETREEFQSFMDRTVGERLRTSKETEKKYADLEARAKGIYADDENALEKLIEAAESQKAEEIGETADEFRRRQQTEREAALYRAAQKEQQDTQNAILEKQREWERDSQHLREVIPDFDFMRAMENKDFAHAVINEGMSVAAAYIKLSNSEKQTAAPARREVFELGAAASRGGAGAVDPVNMNDADFSAYIQSIKDKG